MMDKILLSFVILFLIGISIVYSEWKLQKRIDYAGDYVEQARTDGVDEVIEECVEYKSESLHKSEDNILRLTPREIFAVLGLDNNARLSIETIEHNRGYPFVKIHIEERLKKWAPPPSGWYWTKARHALKIDIRKLDELLGEDVINVKDDNGHLQALGISSYEERIENGIRVSYEREWVEDDSPLNPYDWKFTIEENRERYGDRNEVVWDESDLP